MKLDELRTKIELHREMGGWTYQELADEMGISKAMVKLIENGHKPGPEICKKLNLEPSAKVLRDRARRKNQRDELKRLREENARLKDDIRGMYQLNCQSYVCIFARPSNLAVKL